MLSKQEAAEWVQVVLTEKLLAIGQESRVEVYLDKCGNTVGILTLGITIPYEDIVAQQNSAEGSIKLLRDTLTALFKDF